MKEFTNNISEKGKEVAKNYEIALQERKNAEKLDYNPTKIIVQFDENITSKSIDKAMSVLGDSGTIVSEQFEMAADIPAEKKDYIEEASQISEDKIAVVDVDKGHTSNIL